MAVAPAGTPKRCIVNTDLHISAAATLKLKVPSTAGTTATTAITTTATTETAIDYFVTVLFVEDWSQTEQQQTMAADNNV